MSDPFFDEGHAGTEAQVVAEIATRLLEWCELASRPRVIEWLTRCATLSEKGGAQLMEYLRFQTGDTAAISQTYRERALSAGLTKQGVHKAERETLEAMEANAPKLSEAINELRGLYGFSQGPRVEVPLSFRHS